MSDENKQSKYYRPKIVEEKPLNISHDSPTNKFATKLMSKTSKDGMMDVKLEDSIVIQRIAKDLYSNPLAGFRELYNNAARFVKRANKEYGAKGSIHITLNAAERKLVIHEIDSMGMTIDEFHEKYRYLGRSDNFDRTESGQFGFGKAAVLTLSDIPKFEIYSRTPDEHGEHEAYVLLGRGGIKYEPLVNEVPDLESYGMRITMTCYESIKFHDLVGFILDTVRFKDVDTFLTLEDDVSRLEFLDTDYNTHKCVAGTYKIGPFNIKDFVNKSVDQKMGRAGIDNVRIPIEIDDPDYYFYGVIAAHNEYVLWNSSGDVFLIGAPISTTSKLNVGPVGAYVLNLRNESVFPPTADRERLKDDEDVLDKIEKVIQSKVKASLGNIHIHTIKDYNTSPYKVLLRHYELKPYFDDATRELAELVSWTVQTRADGGFQALGSLDLTNSFWSKTLSLGVVGAMRLGNPTATVFKFKARTSKEVVEDRIELLKKYGIKSAQEYIKEHKLKYRVPKDDVAEKIDYDVWYRDSNYPESVAELDDNIVLIPADKIIHYIGNHKIRDNYHEKRKLFISMIDNDDAKCECGVTRYIKRIKQGGISIKDFMAKHKNIALQTNAGIKTFEQIFAENRAHNRVVVLENNEVEVVAKMPADVESDNGLHGVLWILAPTRAIQWALAFYFFTRGNYSTARLKIQDPNKTRLRYYKHTLGNEYNFHNNDSTSVMKAVMETAKIIEDKELRDMYVTAIHDLGDIDEDDEDYARFESLTKTALRLNKMLGGKDSIEKYMPDNIGPDSVTTAEAIVTVLHHSEKPLSSGDIAQIFAREWKPVDIKNVSRELTTKGKRLHDNNMVERVGDHAFQLTEQGHSWYNTHIKPIIEVVKPTVESIKNTESKDSGE